jgi:hypothetical protein
MAFAVVSWWVILGAAVAAWIFGAVYYTLLSNAWVAAQGKTMEDIKAANAGKSGAAKAFPFVFSFLAEIVMAWVLSGVIYHTGTFSLRAGVISAAFVWTGFVLTTIFVNNAYHGRTLRLSAIDAGHWLGALLIMGAIVGYIGR